MKKFISGRIKAVFYSLSGAFHLLKTEHSIQAQIIISVIFIFLGFYFKISATEWMFKILAIALILSIESLNTAVEMMLKLDDFNKKRKRNKLPPINIGIGINHGSVISGNIGSKEIIYGSSKAYSAVVLIAKFLKVNSIFNLTLGPRIFKSAEDSSAKTKLGKSKIARDKRKVKLAPAGSFPKKKEPKLDADTVKSYKKRIKYMEDRKAKGKVIIKI